VRGPGERDGGDAAATGAITNDATPGTPAGATPPYRLASLDPMGRVRDAGEVAVTVEWPDPPAKLLRAGGINRCDVPRRPALTVHTLNGVRDVVVRLEGVTRGRAPAPAAAVELVVHGCRLEPRVAIAARLGAVLAVINDDERRHEVVLERVEGGAPEPLARIPLPLVGQRFEIALEKSGVVRATSATDARARSWIVVPPHPYVAITDEKDRVRFGDVVPGSYEVVAWHPPFTPGEKPRTAIGSVTVTTSETAELTLSLVP